MHLLPSGGSRAQRSRVGPRTVRREGDFVRGLRLGIDYLSVSGMPGGLPNVRGGVQPALRIALPFLLRQMKLRPYAANPYTRGVRSNIRREDHRLRIWRGITPWRSFLGDDGHGSAR